MNSFLSVSDELLKDPSEVINYCQANGEREVADITKNVLPKAILVRRDGDLVLLCDYKFDPENGLAIVFADNKLKMICNQSEVV